MPNDWFAPHQGYSAGVSVFDAASEFAHLVDTLHRCGLRVTLDVVFNHNAETDTLGVRSLQALDPEGYFRRWPDGTPADGAGCGNEFASDSEFGRRLIRDACRYWVDRFGIDGFRFDLMGLIDRDTLTAVREDLDRVDPSLMIYGEPWAAAPSPREVLNKGFQRGSRIAVFNDSFRDELRGNLFNNSAPGLLINGDRAAARRVAIGGVGRSGGAVGVENLSDCFAHAPTEVIQYAECHDDLTLFDRLLVSDPEGGIEAAQDRSALAALMLMIAPGMPFIHSGQEFGRSKDGISNTYNQGDDANNIRWTDKRIDHRLFRHYRRALGIRASHPMFRPRTQSDVLEHRPLADAFIRGSIPRGVFCTVISDWSGRDEWSTCLLCINTSETIAHLALIGDRWRRASLDSVLLDEDAPSYGHRITGIEPIKPRGFLLVYEPKLDANAIPAS
jgi:pullulanase